MKEAIIKYLTDFLSPEVATILLSAMPVSELRGALPVAMKIFNFTPMKAYVLCVIGNLIPIIPLLFFLNYISHLLMKIGVFKKFFNWWFKRTRKHSNLVEKYEILGLMLFVAVPLPMTGAWSGCVAAYLLGIKFRHALVAITSGVLMAGVIVVVVTLGVFKIL